MLMNRNSLQPANAFSKVLLSVVAALPVVLLGYVLLGGGAWGGINTPGTGLVGVFLLSGLAVVWLYWRSVAGWRWRSTRLDVLLPLWGLAFCVSLVANWEARARVAGGLYFTGVYILLWYMLHDALSNRAITRAGLLNVVLLSGSAVVVAALTEWLEGISRVARPLENPNLLGAFLAMYLPLVVGRTAQAVKRAGRARVFWVGYILLVCFVTLLSGSRGAWLGLVAAAGVWAVYTAARYMPGQRWPYLLVLVAAPLVIWLVAVRGGQGRVEIYQAAFAQFLARPITGHGLFTFRMIDPSMGLPFVHMHTHNVFLQVGVELGIFGLAALGASIYRLGGAALRAFVLRPPSDVHPWLAAALAAAAAHQLVDFVVLAPAIAITFLVILVCAMPEAMPENQANAPTVRPITAFVMLALLAGLVVMLMLVGLLVGHIPPALTGL
jgi:O-antigen ligase